MKPLFDASALLYIIHEHGGKALDLAGDGYLLTITPYEIGNAV